jgi:iron complex outermembrane receptor protein
VFVEYDVPPVSGLTVSSGVIGASRSFLDLDNALRVPAYAQWDAGARYAFTIGTTQFVGRVTAENVTNSSHWLPNTYFGLALSSPRTLKTSVTVGF